MAQALAGWSRRDSARSVAAIPNVAGAAREDWAAVVEELMRGDRAAYSKLARFVTRSLARWHAFDFGDDWADLVQEVLLAVLRAAHDGRVERPEAWVGYVRATAHHKLMDRLRAHVRHGEDEDRPVEEADGPCPAPLRSEARQEIVVDVRCAVGRLPERTQRVVHAIHGRGLTYEEVAEEMRLSRGTVKRCLREGMAALRRDFSFQLDDA